MRVFSINGFNAAVVMLLLASCIPAASKPAPVPVAVVGAESALGYASAIALGKHNAVAVHNTHNLTSLQLVRVLHLRELGIKTMAVDFADQAHVYHFNVTVSASHVVLFADVGDDASLAYLLATKRSLQTIEHAREGSMARQLPVGCFVTEAGLPWLLEKYCQQAPLVLGAVPVPEPNCLTVGKCENMTLANWGQKMSTLFAGLKPATMPAGAAELPASLQSMLASFPKGCDTQPKRCAPAVIEYMTTDYGRVTFTGSLTMERRHKYSLPSAGFFEYPCGMLGPTPYDGDIWERLTAKCDIVVVTAVFGGSDLLRPTPFQVDPVKQHQICFIAVMDAITEAKHTAEMNMTAKKVGSLVIGQVGMWKTVTLRPDHKQPFPYFSTRRTSRVPKLLIHRLFPKVKHAVWVDGNLQVNQTVPQYISNTLGTTNVMALGTHRGGRTALGESKLTSRNLENARVSRIQEQVYHLDYPTFTKDKILWAASIVRDNQDISVQWASCVWFNDWTRYSQRDQVSQTFALTRTNTRKKTGAFPYQWMNGAPHKHHHGTTV